MVFSSVTAQVEKKKENNKVSKSAENQNTPQAITDEIKFKNETGNAIITITDEGNDAGSITLPKASTPTFTTDKLYHIGGGILHFDGQEIGSELTSFKLSTGASNGFVLTSDANGNASWQIPSNSSDSDWQISTNDMYSIPSGNVGIGTNTPSDKLELISSSGQDAFRVRIGSATKLRVFSNGGTAIGSNNSAGTPENGLYVSGNVGLGVSSPNEKLEVNGKIKTSQLQITTGASDGRVFTSDANGNGSWQSIATGDDDWFTTGSHIYSRTGGGNVGIGTALPAAKLEVLGDIKARDIQLTTGATNGYVLTSDADGNASWQESVSGSDDDWTINGNEAYRFGKTGINTGSPNSILSVGGQGNSSATFSAETSTPDGYGVYGVTKGSGYGVGIYGTVSGAGANDQSVAVFGNHINGGIGVRGHTTGLSGIAILGTRSSTTGLAGRFEGPVEVTGKLSVGSNPTAMAYQLAVDGTAAKSSGGTSWAVASDNRLKNIHGNYKKGLDEINKLRAIIFNYKNGNPLNLPSDNLEYGFIAQEVQKIFPEAVSEMNNGYLDFNFHPILVAMVNAMKELSRKNEELKSELETIKINDEKIRNVINENTILKNEMKNIKNQILEISEHIEK